MCERKLKSGELDQDHESKIFSSFSLVISLSDLYCRFKVDSISDTTYSLFSPTLSDIEEMNGTVQGNRIFLVKRLRYEIRARLSWLELECVLRCLSPIIYRSSKNAHCVFFDSWWCLSTAILRWLTVGGQWALSRAINYAELSHLFRLSIADNLRIPTLSVDRHVKSSIVNYERSWKEQVLSLSCTHILSESDKFPVTWLVFRIPKVEGTSHISMKWISWESLEGHDAIASDKTRGSFVGLSQEVWYEVHILSYV